MWHACVGLLTALMIAIGMYVPVRAQQPEAKFAEEFTRWQQATDNEQRITLGETLLASEASLTTWPLAAERTQVRAELQFGVASAYINRPTGIRADNIEAAIRHFEAAQPAWTIEGEPQNWATLRNNLAIAYWGRIRGERADNQERAIAHFEAALRVFTQAAAPQEWARLQNNLAVVYQSRIRGVAADNLEAAIAHTENALGVFTRDAAPMFWAMAQNNLASIYRSRVRGVRAENHERAIGHLRGALGVFTRESVPREWASAHYNLGSVYLASVSGERADNQELAIAHFDTALTVFTRDGYPMEWARAQSALGNAYAGRIRGLSGINRELAIAAFDAALSVFTRDAFPHEHLRTARALGHILLQAGSWQEAHQIHTSAREAFLLLFGQGFDDVEARAIISEAGPLFAEAALSAIERGAPEDAIALADEGRARLLSVSLRLQSLELSNENRSRLEALRAEVRKAQQAVEAASGTERVAAIEHLAGQRRELLALVSAGGAATDRGAAALAEARRITAEGGVVAIPIVTALGGRLIVLTGAGGTDSAIIDLPELTPERLSVLLAGADGHPETGWVGAYFANYFDGEEKEKRWPRWLTAIDDLGPELWRLFGSELDAAIKARGIQPGARLVWVPSGWLGVLPLALAQDPVSKRRLGDDYEITVTPSLAALAAVRERAAQTDAPSLAAAINPTGDLPGSEMEGALVAAHFADGTRTLLVGESATLDGVLGALKGRTHWHFASHGTFSWSDVRQSALIMHGFTRLSVGRLLETDGLGRPRLVVLSACETGLSDLAINPDEFVGLPSAFIALGAAGVLGTLWPVSDAATALLISRFYELHIGERLRPATALHRAQAWLRQATNAELASYVEAAASTGRLTSQQARTISEALAPEALKRGRNRTTVEWIARTPMPPEAQKAKEAEDPTALARPFAHPYFWAGFVHTGH